MRTGLSRRKGGRCWGSRVYCLFGTELYGIGFTMPGKNTTTGTFPIKTVLENDRFGGEERGAVGTPLDEIGAVKVDAGTGD